MGSRRIEDLGEFDLLDLIRAHLGQRLSTTVRGPGGDAAILETETGRLALSTDAAVEGVHFDLRFMSLADAGWRAVVGALGDLSAVGAEPRAVLLSCGFRGELEVASVEELFATLDALGEEEGFDLVGGDVVASPHAVFFDVVVVGRLTLSSSVDRSGARPGDLLAVTGTLGGAMAGLASLRRAGKRPSDPSPAELDYLRPGSPLRPGIALAACPIHAMTDISDGLAEELLALARANEELAFVVDPTRLPVAEGVDAEAKESGRDPAEMALSGGEDSELLLTVLPEDYSALKRALDALHPATRLTVIGEVIGAPADAPAQQRTLARSQDGEIRPLALRGFEHFRRSGR